jgi:hypothetical protein
MTQAQMLAAYPTIPCNIEDCITFQWMTLTTLNCSKPCDGGFQTQSSTCYSSKDGLVGDWNCLSPKPPRVVTCNTQACPETAFIISFPTPNTAFTWTDQVALSWQGGRLFGKVNVALEVNGSLAPLAAGLNNTGVYYWPPINVSGAVRFVLSSATNASFLAFSAWFYVRAPQHYGLESFGAPVSGLTVIGEYGEADLATPLPADLVLADLGRLLALRYNGTETAGSAVRVTSGGLAAEFGLLEATGDALSCNPRPEPLCVNASFRATGCQWCPPRSLCAPGLLCTPSNPTSTQSLSSATTATSLSDYSSDAPSLSDYSSDAPSLSVASAQSVQVPLPSVTSSNPYDTSNLASQALSQANNEGSGSSDDNPQVGAGHHVALDFV